MATTTNYGWTTPDDTALVKDGASAIRTLGSSVDTTTKNLNPSTTLGDIEYRSSTANTNTRLGIGTTGQVLSVSGGVPAWATVSSGGMTLLSTTTLSGATTTISGISGSYNSLIMFIYGVTNATNSSRFNVTPNNVANAVFVNNATGTTLASQGPGDIELSGTGGTNGPLLTDADNVWTVQIDNYASSTARKSFEVYGQYMNAASTRRGYFAFGGLTATTAITSLVFYNNGGDLSTGTVLLYGVK